VAGGEFGVLTGACCDVDGVCTVTTESACPPPEKRWAGANTTCSDPGYRCCQYPFADADKDRDVDQVDFAAFQLCYTGPGGGVPPGCECWDREPDSDVDADDFTAFNDCWTGPNVLYSVALPPLCNP
jgi:hypothetical protein